MNCQKILIIATRQIGDTLITTPLISAARRIWPTAQIDFFGYDNSLSMLSGNPDIHHAFVGEYSVMFKKRLSPSIHTLISTLRSSYHHTTE